MIDKLLLPSLVSSMAKAFHEGNDSDFTVFLGKVHDHPGFDRAFYDTMPKIVDAIPEFDVLALRRAMATLSSITRPANVGGRSMVAEFQIFFLPISGTVEAMEDLVSDAAALAALSASFRKAGLVDDRSHAVALPFTVSAWRAGTLTAWELRAAVRAVMPILKGSRTNVESASDTLSSIFEDLGTVNTGGAAGPAVLGQTLLPVGRIAYHPSDRRADDMLSPRTIDEADDETVFRRWRDDVSSIGGAALDIGEPCSWARACAMAAIRRIEHGLAVACLEVGLPEPVHYEKLMIHADDDAFYITAIHAGKLMGPVDVPMQLALAEFDFLADALSDMAFDVEWSDDDTPSSANIN